MAGIASDRWTCPDCPTVVHRPTGVGDDAWTAQVRAEQAAHCCPQPAPRPSRRWFR